MHNEVPAVESNKVQENEAEVSPNAKAWTGKKPEGWVNLVLLSLHETETVMEFEVAVAEPSVHEKQTVSLYKMSRLIFKMDPVMPLSSTRNMLV